MDRSSSSAGWISGDSNSHSNSGNSHLCIANCDRNASNSRVERNPIDYYKHLHPHANIYADSDLHLHWHRDPDSIPTIDKYIHSNHYPHLDSESYIYLPAADFDIHLYSDRYPVGHPGPSLDVHAIPAGGDADAKPDSISNSPLK